MDGKRYAFNLSWYDRQADLYRPYQLFYWSFAVGDSKIEMHDMHTHRIFLKRTTYPSLKLRDIYIGNTVEIFGRQMKVESYADEFTTSSFSSCDSKSLLFVSQSASASLGDILHNAEEAGFQITQLRSFMLSSQEASLFCSGRIELLSFFKNPVVALELLGKESNDKWEKFIGQFKESEVYVCKSKSEADADAHKVFGDRIGYTSATFDSCSLCLIKPHCFKEKSVGSVVASVLKGGFSVTAMELFRLNRTNTEEFLEVYRGVSPDYQAMVDCITSGPCIALEIRSEDAVKFFREFCGPSDVDIAKHLRPNTLRAVYGTDRILNAVHCTDLASDGTIECDYFFNVLQTA